MIPDIILIYALFLIVKVYRLGQKSWQVFFFFDDTSPVGKCDIYRRKDKVLTTCVDTMPADIPHDTFCAVVTNWREKGEKLFDVSLELPSPLIISTRVEHKVGSRDEMR